MIIRLCMMMLLIMHPCPTWVGGVESIAFYWYVVMESHWGMAQAKFSGMTT